MRAALVILNIVVSGVLLAVQAMCYVALYDELYPMAISLGYLATYSRSGSMSTDWVTIIAPLQWVLALTLFIIAATVTDVRRRRWRGLHLAARDLRKAVSVAGLPSVGLFALGMVPVFCLRFTSWTDPGGHPLMEELAVLLSYGLSWVPFALALREQSRLHAGQ